MLRLPRQRASSLIAFSTDFCVHLLSTPRSCLLLSVKVLHLHRENSKIFMHSGGKQCCLCCALHDQRPCKAKCVMCCMVWSTCHHVCMCGMDHSAHPARKAGFLKS